MRSFLNLHSFKNVLVTICLLNEKKKTSHMVVCVTFSLSVNKETFQIVGLHVSVTIIMINHS